jgi:shikimate kinase
VERVGEALSHGAITVVNAMATGKGAALGINLWTKARVTITDHAGVISGRNLTDQDEDPTLMINTVRRVLRRFNKQNRFGAKVETQSCIPVAVGLKSSSAASNAVALATLKALRRRAGDLETVNLGVDASFAARVTLTGAFDDACACYFGGLNVTDNTHRKILRRFRPSKGLRALIYLPRKRMYTREVDLKRLQGIKQFIEGAHDEALKGNYWLALALNGIFYSRALGYDVSPVKKALEAGAITAGLTGKGPAISAVVPNSKIDRVLSTWNSLPGRVIEASLNNEKAKPLRAAT